MNNPQIKKMPKTWKGGGYVGKRFSDCPVELLDHVADLERWMWEQQKDGTSDEDRKWSAFHARRSKLAGAWAKRLRRGWTPPPPPDNVKQWADKSYAMRDDVNAPAQKEETPEPASNSPEDLGWNDTNDANEDWSGS